MKYEYSVECGDSFFIGCTDENHMVAVMYKSCVGFYLTDVIKTFQTIEDAMNTSIVNMYVDKVCVRRIINEHKRWTVEDQKAGKLPEVGDGVTAIGFDDDAKVAAINNDGVCVVFSDGGFITLHTSGILPLETPEEKAKRLRSEWVGLVRDKALISADEYTTEAIYDALLSGALSVPSKGGE